MLRFAYGCIPSLMSLSFANNLVRRAGLRPTSIVLSAGGVRFQKKQYTPAQVLPLFLRRFGPRFTAYNVLVGLSGSLPFPVPGSGLMGFRQLSRTYGIPLVLSEDFSGEGTVSQLRNQGVELFVTSMCDQILREPLLSLPRHGCVNLHASLLPEFRGVDSIFQSMLHDAPEAGVTLHQTTARIDCGNVYAQASFPRAAGDSHLLLTVKATTAGVPLLKRHVLALERGETPPSWPLDVSKARFPYRSWPERDELRRFSERGLSFWRSSDLLRILRFDESLAPHQ